MEGEGVQSGLDKQGEGAVIVVREDEKIEVEIREILRVRPQDFGPLKNSFEDWANSWR